MTNVTVIPGVKAALEFPEAFQSKALIDFLREVKSQYDMAFYDSPALPRYGGANILSSLMDDVFLVM